MRRTLIVEQAIDLFFEVADDFCSSSSEVESDITDDEIDDLSSVIDDER